MMRISVPRSSRWVAKLWTSRSHLPPLPQQIERLWRQHDVAVFAPLGLHDADDVLRPVDITNPEPDHLARAQTCAVAESEQYVNLESPRHGQEALGLVRAHHQRDLLGCQTALNRDPGSVCKRYPFWRGGTTALAPGGAGQGCAAGASAVAWEGALSARRGF